MLLVQKEDPSGICNSPLSSKMSRINQPWLIVFPLLCFVRAQNSPLNTGRNFPFKHLLKSKGKTKIPFLQLPLSSEFSWLRVFCGHSTCETQGLALKSQQIHSLILTPLSPGLCILFGQNWTPNSVSEPQSSYSAQGNSHPRAQDKLLFPFLTLIFNKISLPPATSSPTTAHPEKFLLQKHTFTEKSYFLALA